MPTKPQAYLLFALTLLATGALGQHGSATIYVDSTNRLFVSPTKPVNICVGTTPDGANAVKLVGIDKKGDPLFWNGHGPIQMAYLNLYAGHKIRFDLFADGIPPQSRLLFSKPGQQDSEAVLHISGGGVVEIDAVDTDSGLDKVFFAVNGSSFEEYTRPISFDEEGLYTIQVYSIDNLGNREDEVTRRFTIDNTPPTSALSVEGDRHGNTLSGRATLHLAATDRFGVDNIKYRVDTAELVTYRSPIRIAQLPEGEHTLAWFSSDNSGNAEQEQAFTFFVDKTPPMVLEEISGVSYMVGNKEFSSGNSLLKIAAVDNKAGIREIFYSLNNGNFIRYEKPVMLSDIMGTVSVKSYAVDNVGNRSQSSANTGSLSIPTIDIAGPVLTYRLEGAKLKQRNATWIAPSTKIHLNASDGESGVNRVAYSVNGLAETEYSGPFTLTESGRFQIKVAGYDNVDNLNILSFEVEVDSTAPEIFHHFSVKPYRQVSENNETLDVYPPDVKLFLAATDNLSGEVTINYSIDEGKPTAYRNPVEKLTSGKTYTLNISVVDKLGNKAEESIKFKVE